MTQIETCGHQLAEILKQQKADYIEARLEESHTSHITYRRGKLESIDNTTAIGGNVRALVKGGWGFTSFNDLSDLSARVELAVKQAQFVGHEESNLATVEPATDTVTAEVNNSPLKMSLADKKQVLDEYNDIICRTPKIQTSTINYGDGSKKSIFLNSAGSFIEQEKVDLSLRLVAVATEGIEVQQAGLSLGSNGDFHEAFGHLSEADFVYENDRMRQIMTLGTEFGGSELSIVDSAAVPGLRGSYKYDDEGVPSTKTYLIREGKLVGRLHSKETAARMNEQPTGNARAINYRYPPIVRMTNTYIEPRSMSLSDILADIKEGVYVKNWYGGTTSMEMFTFSAGEAYMIRDGKIAELLRPVVLTGNVFNTLKNIDAIGDDLEMNQGGGCGKGAQSPLPVTNGSPHIRIRQCLIGGS